ncbi:unnamed protein product [Caretta caretta]
MRRRRRGRRRRRRCSWPAPAPRSIVLRIMGCDIKLMKSAAGCGSPGACMKRLLVKKYAQGLVEMLSRTNCYPAPWASGSIGEP